MLTLLTYFLKSKILATIFVIGLAVLAVAEAADNHTLIIISLITNGTILVGMVVSAVISLHNAKKLTTMSVNVDGALEKLLRSTKETAHLRGAAQERTEARDRRNADDETHKVEITNPESQPVPTKPVRKR